MVPQNLSCHDGDSTMIDFVRLLLLRHHVCKYFQPCVRVTIVELFVFSTFGD